ncbi:MAG: porin family protein [Gemmatimonadetes bacterium]|nr:porin family protein [Gemmatimonadota bacterium]
MTTVAIPAQRFRIGIGAGERVAVEPAIAFNWIKPSGDDGLTTAQAELGLVFHLATDPAKARPYLRPAAGLTRLSAGGDGTTTFDAGVGLGVKVPVRSVTKFAIRLEAGYRHGFKKEADLIPASDNLVLLVGFSFNTR